MREMGAEMLTPTQREKCVRLWREGWPMKAIEHELGITHDELKHETNYRRELYPKRYQRKVEA